MNELINLIVKKREISTATAQTILYCHWFPQE